MHTIYIMLSGTGTLFSKIIKLKLRDDCPHVSLILDNDFKKGYSFGRRKLRNPLIAGFTEETYEDWLNVFKNIKCEVYELNLSDEQYGDLLKNLDKFKVNKQKYRYHLIGVIGRGLGYNIKIENHYFCSQFVSEILMDSNALDLGLEPICCVADMFRTCNKLKQVYRGSLDDLLDNSHHIVQHTT